ncbi:MAG: hypothetical protein P9L97_13315 [Candidatus Tenebribacter davisii]|jgi:hypothetical protein|nr:hypothetical protein [Candidatus Tenebribacter davisii]
MQINIKKCYINGQRRIALRFDYDINTIDLIKQLEGRKWSASSKFWHTPFYENYLKKLNNQFEVDNHDLFGRGHRCFQ